MMVVGICYGFFLIILGTVELVFWDEPECQDHSVIFLTAGRLLFSLGIVNVIFVLLLALEWWRQWERSDAYYLLMGVYNFVLIVVLCLVRFDGTMSSACTASMVGIMFVVELILRCILVISCVILFETPDAAYEELP